MAIFIYLKESLLASWGFFQDAAPFFLFGLLLAGTLRLFLSTEYVTSHLGKKGLSSILKAALIGIPLPLCSCSVLPVAASLKRQGANKGAISAFLISTPESGIDSILISWALLDPIMTFARPVAAFISSVGTGLLENLMVKANSGQNTINDKDTLSQGCGCSGSCCQTGCSNEEGKEATFWDTVKKVFDYAFFDLWEELGPWFFLGVVVAGLIYTLIPDELFTSYLQGGILSMILMLFLGIPIYICASASTPVAAAMILKGMSPGAALVFLLVGPATNITSISILYGILGKKGTAVYLLALSFFSVLSGLILDYVYNIIGVSPMAIIGKAAELIPPYLMTASATILLIFFVINLTKKNRD